MSPRRPRRRRPAGRSEPAAPLDAEVEPGPDDWLVRPVTGAATTKAYRCPGCDQELRPGTPHVVAWRASDSDDRRHWHTPCWRAKDRRQVKVHRAKNAPRHG